MKGRIGLRHAIWASVALAGAAVLGSAPDARGQIAPVPPLPTGGVMHASAELADRWCWSGAWRYPVGNARDFQLAAAGSSAGYRLSRNIGGPDLGTRTHQGADLSCGHGGDLVRAAATGLVVAAPRRGYNSGYGRYVVLGHRLCDGQVAYSVYAHLAAGTIRVRPGQSVLAGGVLGRVGRTGRATSPHLHFEVRLADDPSAPWQNTRVVDPLSFVADRLPAAARADSLAPWWDWAAYAGLLADSLVTPASVLRHAEWWRMLAVAGAHQWTLLPEADLTLRDSLIAAGLLPERSRATPGETVSWEELARDLRRLEMIGAALPARPAPDRQFRSVCREILGQASPDRDPSDLARREAPPHALDAVLLIADLAPAAPAPRARGRDAAP